MRERDTARWRRPVPLYRRTWLARRNRVAARGSGTAQRSRRFLLSWSPLISHRTVAPTRTRRVTRSLPETRQPGSEFGVDNCYGQTPLGEPSSSRFRGDDPTPRRAERRWAMATATEKSVMNHVGCPSCRLRFTAAAAACLLACPECGRPPRSIASAEGVLGFRLFVVEDAPRELPEAVAVSISVPDPGTGRS
jgi:hypothetical protein